MKKSDFASRCYELLLCIPRGKITTYKELSTALGSKAYRAVGNAMHCNPNAPRVPCHRVVKSTGAIGGYAGGAKKKIALLKAEGVEVEAGLIRDFEKRLIRSPSLLARLKSRGKQLE